MPPYSYVQNQAQHKRKVILGLAFVPIAFIITYIISSHFSLSEHFTQWALQYEEIAEIDELPLALLASLLAMVWFSTQRIAESRNLMKRNHALLQRVLDTQEAERKAIAQHLHDDLGQYLNAIKAEAAGLCIGENADAMTASTAKRIAMNTDHAYKATRMIMRNLRPIALDELGLSAAIEHLVDQWNTTMPAIDYHLQIKGDVDRFNESMNIAIFRIVQESMTNVAKHAKASEVRVNIKRTADVIQIEIVDNGIGFDTPPPQTGYGLLGMAERIESVFGHLKVDSTPLQGTSICVNIPTP